MRPEVLSVARSWAEGQRDSCGNLVYGDANGLFDYFLIDTQMTSCQLTSRVVQAYIAVQIFVERCLLNLEAPGVVIDPNDPTWKEWSWRSRYRIWQANREVFLYPENWLIESQRPNRTEIYQKLEQEVHQGQSTTDYLETVVLNYIDRLDGLAHLLVTGTCEDATSGDIYVVARTLADPPLFYYRSYVNDAWSGWVQIPLDIKAHQAVPALYRGRLCLFWIEVKISNEPNQGTPAAQASPRRRRRKAAISTRRSRSSSAFSVTAVGPRRKQQGESSSTSLFTTRT
jgi:Neuraminidase-like domain